MAPEFKGKMKILMDTRGPEIRTGTFEVYNSKKELKAGFRPFRSHEDVEVGPGRWPMRKSKKLKFQFERLKFGKMATSSIAQGGGGSFKNRKPIGEVGCCESRMAERIH